MQDDTYNEMISKLNDIVKKLTNHKCKHADCCIELYITGY